MSIINELEPKTILRSHKKIDSWFLCHYGMNLYRGCAHNCVYCDGRAEKYRVEGEFGKDVGVKVNARELLDRALNPKRKRKPFKRSFIAVGGGVGDSYQPAEKKYQLTRQALEVIEKWSFPALMLTKNTLVERDMDILKRIHEKERVVVCMSLSTADDQVGKQVEPGAALPSERLRTLERFKKEGLGTGIFYMPVIPFITDKPAMIDATVRQAASAGVEFVIFGGMTLKDGRQKEHFHTYLDKHHPELSATYHNLYPSSPYGEARGDYYQSLNQLFLTVARKHRMPIRMPERLWSDIVSETDRVIVLLEHLDYTLKLLGRSSPYGYAAYQISQLEAPVREMRGKLRSLRGVGPTTERIIHDILNTGSSRYYHSLLAGA